MPTIYRWTKEYTDKINRIQFHSMLHHPLTCGNRSEPGHEVNGRDKAILIAKQEGYLECPFCGQKQHGLPDGYISESKLKLTPDDIEYHESPAAFMKYKKEKQAEDGESLEAFVQWSREQPKEAEPSKEVVEEAIQRWKQVQKDNAKALGIPVDEYLAEDAPFFLTFRKEPPIIDRSSLMRRLLEGKEPLPYPPPKNGAYPWYSLIESDEIHQVSLAMGQPTIFAVDSYSKAVRLGQLVVNGNGWNIVSANEDAMAFLNLQDHQWLYTEDGKYVRPEYYTDKALAIAFGNPEFVVRDTFYGDFRVWFSLAGGTSTGYRYTSYHPNMELFLLRDDLSGINPVITKVLKKCDPDRVDDGLTDGEINIEALTNPDFTKTLEQFGASFLAAQPELDHDWCEFSCGGWLMEKIK